MNSVISCKAGVDRQRITLGCVATNRVPMATCMGNLKIAKDHIGLCF